MIRNLLAALVVLTASLNVQAQEANSKGLVTAEIHTSAECGMCKKKIEDALYYTKGVKKAELNPKTQVLTVTYKEGKTDLDKIREVVAAEGYDADAVEADPTEYDKLPACCRKGAHAHERDAN